MIEVIGYLGEPGVGVRERVADADLVVGGARQLDAFDVPAERRVVLGKLQPAIEALTELDEGALAVVLASGDPNYYGIVRRLRLVGLHPVVRPAPSAVAMAFGAVGVPRDEAIVVSAHGRSLRPALAMIRTHPKVAVMTGPDQGLRELAAAVPDLERWFVLAERLGEDDERVRVLSRAEALRTSDVREPNVVLVLTEHPDEMAAAGLSLPISGQFTDPLNPEPIEAPATWAFALTLPRQGEICWVLGPLANRAGVLAQANLACVLDAVDPAELLAIGLAPDVVIADEASDELLSALSDLRVRRIVAIGDAAATPLRATLSNLDWTELPAGQQTLWIGDRP